jgi:hypothetical protein
MAKEAEGCGDRGKQPYSPSSAAVEEEEEEMDTSDDWAANMPGVKEMIEGSVRPEDQRSPEQPHERLMAAGSADTPPQLGEPKPVLPPAGGNRNRDSNSGTTTGDNKISGADTSTAPLPRAGQGSTQLTTLPPPVTGEGIY